MNTKKLKIDWLDNCPKCERSTVTVSTVKGSLEKLFDGDKVECWCGQTGVIDTGDNNAWVEWDEVVSSNKDNHDAYYREKYPDFWNRLPGCNHQAWTHYETSLNSWLVALHRAEAKLEGCVVVPLENARYFSNDGENYEIHETLEQAKHEAECAIEHYSERLADQEMDPTSDGNFHQIGYGVILAESTYSIDHVVTQEDIDNGDYSYEVGTQIMTLSLEEARGGNDE